jgi:TonB family protein
MNYGSIQNSKYGEIKIEPLMQTEQDKTELMALTQQQTPAAAASASKQQTKKEQKQEKNNEKKALSAAAGGALAGNAKKTINNKPSVKESSKSAEPSTAEKTAEKPSEVKKESAAKPVAAAATVKKETKPEIPSIDYNQVFLEPLLDSKKRQVVKQVAPEVTDAMRRILVSGRVIVRVVVGKDGRVETAQILRGINDLYDEKCVEAAKKFIFKPGKVKGVPVRFSTNLFFRFGTGK